MEHVEVLREMLDDAAIEPPWEPEEVAAITAAIASLSAPQPPAEAQPCGCGEATCTVPWEPGCGLGKSEQHAVVESAPPSAPVGVSVDVVREYLDARACYDAATRPPNSHARAPVLKHDDPDALRLREARVALDNAIALAQQPAAVDSEMVTRAVNAYDEATGEGWQMPCLQGMRAALTAALAGQQGGAE